MSTGTRRQSIKSTQSSRDTNRTTQVRANTEHTSTRSNQRALAAGTPTGNQTAVEGVDALAEDVVVRVGHHH